jgi:hypothetical protein
VKVSLTEGAAGAGGTIVGWPPNNVGSEVGTGVGKVEGSDVGGAEPFLWWPLI